MSECILGRGQRKKISARVFIRSPKKEIQTEPEAFYNRRRKGERRRIIDSLFDTAEKTPLSFEEEGHALRHTHTHTHTHTLPTLFERREGQRHTHTHTHAKDARARLRKDGATPP